MPARFAGQITFQNTFTEHRVVEGAKPDGLPPQATDKTELTQNPALNRSETHFARKGESVFSLPLSLDQRDAGEEMVGVELSASISRVTDFTGPVSEVKSTRKELAPLPDMLSPRHEETERVECPGLKALQSWSLGQLTPQSSEAVAGIELAGVGRQVAQLRVGDTRCITVTSLNS